MSLVCEYPSVTPGERIRVECRHGLYSSHRRAGFLNRKVHGSEITMTAEQAGYAHDYARTHGHRAGELVRGR